VKQIGLPADVLAVSIAEIWSEREALTAFLAPAELSAFRGFQVDKRRQDWLAGRIAAKRAVERATGLPMERIEIRTDLVGPTRGRPYAAIRGKETILGVLSITHAGWIAAATFNALPVGLDLELVIPHDDSFTSLAFTEEERRAWSHLGGAARDLAITRAWCMKEAISKWRGCGLRAPFDELLLREDPRVRVDDGTVRDGDALYCWARVWGPLPRQPTQEICGRSVVARPREESRA
jgi:phosphopantetheinyl transferase